MKRFAQFVVSDYQVVSKLEDTIDIIQSTGIESNNKELNSSILHFCTNLRANFMVCTAL